MSKRNFVVLGEGEGLEGYRQYDDIYIRVVKTTDFWYVSCYGLGIETNHLELTDAINSCKNEIEKLLENETISSYPQLTKSLWDDSDSFSNEKIELEFRYPALLHVIDEDPEYIQILDKKFGKYNEDYSSYYWKYDTKKFKSDIKINFRKNEASLIIYLKNTKAHISYYESLTKTERDVNSLIQKAKNPTLFLKEP